MCEVVGRLQAPIWHGVQSNPAIYVSGTISVRVGLAIKRGTLGVILP
jgi:hypothetical protein